jgi:hypothetical protein
MGCGKNIFSSPESKKMDIEQKTNRGETRRQSMKYLVFALSLSLLIGISAFHGTGANAFNNAGHAARLTTPGAYQTVADRYWRDRDYDRPYVGPYYDYDYYDPYYDYPYPYAYYYGPGFSIETPFFGINIP